MRAHDLKGRQFSRLTVVSRSENRGSRVHWSCVCECGGKADVAGKNLLNGNTRSCGCLLAESRSLNGKANATHGRTYERSWNSWSAMRHRCQNANDPAYSRYGGRGIKVHARWEKFENFLADMGERPEGKTLDRFPNNDGDYEPGNCRWATREEQARNKRSNVLNECLVKEIRAADINERTSDLAVRLGLKREIVGQCRRGDIWVGV